MKRNRLKLVLGGSATITLSVAGIPIPGCEAMRNDPRTFFAENTCNIFNCDTLFFLEGEHDEAPDDHDGSEPDATGE